MRAYSSRRPGSHGGETGLQRSYVMAGAALATALAKPAQADVVIGPRVSYYFDNSNLRTSDLDGLRDALDPRSAR